MDATLIAQKILVHLYDQYKENGREEIGFYFDFLEKNDITNKADIIKALNYLENNGYISDLDRDDMSALITSEGIIFVDNGGPTYIREIC